MKTIVIIYSIIVILNYSGMCYLFKKDFGKVDNYDRFFFITISPFVPIISFLMALSFHLYYKYKK